MYTLSKKKRRKKFYINGEELINISHFDMKSRHDFSIEGITVKNIRIYSFELAHPLVSKSVKIRFKKWQQKSDCSAAVVRTMLSIAS